AGALQRPPGQQPHRVLVLYDQDGFAPTSWRLDRPNRPICRVGDCGQVHLHRGPVARLAIEPDVAVGLLDNAIGGREAKTGALPYRLGGKERLEGAGSRRWIHSGTSIADTQGDIGASLISMPGWRTR